MTAHPCRCARRARAAGVLGGLALLAAACGGGVGTAYDPVAATVNGAPIPASEVVGTLRLQLGPEQVEQLGGPGRAVRYHDTKRGVLASLIQTEVMVQQARRMGVTAADDEIDTRMRRIRARFDTEGKFLAALRIAGVDVPGLRRAVRRGILQDKVAAEAGKGAVPEAELRAAYDQNKALFESQFHIAHILLCEREDRETGLCAVESQQDVDVARSLVTRLRSGADFADLARRFSTDRGTAFTGGDFGWVSQADVPAAFGTAMGRLQPGDVSDPVRTILGVHVVKLLERGRSFEAARDEIEQAIGGDRVQQKVNAFLSDVIGDATIRVNPRFGRFDPRTQQVLGHEPNPR